VRAAHKDAYDRAMGAGDDAAKKPAPKNLAGQIDDAINNLLQYRAGGDGVRAL